MLTDHCQCLDGLCVLFFFVITGGEVCSVLIIMQFRLKLDGFVIMPLINEVLEVVNKQHTSGSQDFSVIQGLLLF